MLMFSESTPTDTKNARCLRLGASSASGPTSRKTWLEREGFHATLANRGVRSRHRVASTGGCQSDCFLHTRPLIGFLCGLFRGGSHCVKFVTSALGRSIRHYGRNVHGDGLAGPKGCLEPNIRMAGREGFEPSRELYTPYPLSRRVLSATQPPPRSIGIVARFYRP
jgi:hypothetical protein